MRRGEILAEKRCPACSVTKPRDQYHKNGPSIAQCCKACTNTRKRERYHADARVRETVCAQVARWAAAHADERAAYKRAWVERNRERVRAYNRAHKRRRRQRERERAGRESVREEG